MLIEKTSEEIHHFHWDRFRDTTMGRYLLRHEQAFLQRCLNHSNEVRRILDVCCGSGRMTLPLHKLGYQVTGIDVDPAALSRLRQHSSDIPLTLGDAVHLPYQDSSFDLVIATQCIDYLPYRQALDEFWRVLSPGGLLIFDALNRHSYKWYGKNVSRRSLALPSANLCYSELLADLVNGGYVVESTRGYNWLPFVRTSNSRLIPLAGVAERVLQLPHLSRISPKILIAARKTPLS
jgi:ubiquinone/menaquinone biosynthesis C-methylase UbiE